MELDAHTIVAHEVAAVWYREEAWLEQQRLRAAQRPAPVRRAPVSRSSDDLHQALLEIPADTWLPALTNIEMPRSRTIRCPFHANGQERTPSCRLYDTSFYCFGCQAGGDIFAFASNLYGIPTQGRSFPELRERLADHLLGMAAAA